MNVACPDVRDDMMIASDRITTTNHSRHDGHLSPLWQFFLKPGSTKWPAARRVGIKMEKSTLLKWSD